MGKQAILTAFVLLFTACWGGQWVDSPGRVEDIDLRTAQMARTLDSVKTVARQNEALLRAIQAQAGMRGTGEIDDLREIIDQLERMLSSGSSSLSSDTPASVQTAFEEAYRQYQQGGYSVASQGFLEIALGNPQASIAPEALYYLALCHQNLGETHRAIEEFVAVYFRYPASERAPAALARAAAIYGAHSAESDMNRLESLIVEIYPASEEARLIAGRRSSQ